MSREDIDATLKMLAREGGLAMMGLDTPMTLRDYFAAKAMQGLCASLRDDAFDELHDGIRAGGREAKVAFTIADAMLAERAK